MHTHPPPDHDPDYPLQKPVDLPFKVGGGGLVVAAVLITVLAGVLFVFALIMVGR